MENSEPREPSPPSDEPDPLRRLEEQLDRASDAAERLIAEAAAKAAEAGPKPPTAGWEARRTEAPGTRGRDLEVLVEVVQSLRELLPPELERRLVEALRELLLAIRALIDWYLECTDQGRSAPAEVQDIPIR